MLRNKIYITFLILIVVGCGDTSQNKNLGFSHMENITTKFISFILNNKSLEMKFELRNDIFITVKRSDRLQSGFIPDYELTKSNNFLVYARKTDIAFRFLDSYLIFDSERSMNTFLYYAFNISEVGLGENYLGKNFHLKGEELVENLFGDSDRRVNIKRFDEYINSLDSDDRLIFICKNILAIIYVVGEELKNKYSGQLTWGYNSVYDKKIWIALIKYDENEINITDFCIGKLIYEEHNKRTLSSIVNSLEIIISHRYGLKPS